MVDNIYCLELMFILTIEIDEKGHIDRDFDLKKKKTRGITKKT